MSVSARIRQYGTMRAVGMSADQVVNMIAAEAGTYSLFGTILGCAVGIPLNKLSFETLVTDYFGTAWRLPLGLIGVIVLLVALATAAAVHGRPRPGKTDSQYGHYHHHQRAVKLYAFLRKIGVFGHAKPPIFGEKMIHT